MINVLDIYFLFAGIILLSNSISHRKGRVIIESFLWPVYIFGLVALIGLMVDVFFILLLVNKKYKRYSIISVDFDNTLFSNCYKNLNTTPTILNLIILDLMKFLKKRGHQIVLNTLRTGDKLTEAVTWSNQRGLYFTEVNNNVAYARNLWEIDSRKIAADVYIDDRGTGLLNLLLRMGF